MSDLNDQEYDIRMTDMRNQRSTPIFDGAPDDPDDDDVEAPDLSDVTEEMRREEEHHMHRRRMSREHIARIKREKRRKRIVAGVCVAIAVLIGMVVAFAVSAWITVKEARAAVADAQSVQRYVLSGDTADAQKSVDSLSGHIDRSFKQTSSILWQVASWTPYVGGDISAIRQTVSIMEDVSNNALPQLGESIGGLSLKDLNISAGKVDLSVLNDAAPNLKTAANVIHDANIRLQNVSGTHIPAVSDALGKAQSQFSTLDSMTDTAYRVSNLLPSMFGTDGSSKAYLVLAQNNAELRPTGGMPGSWGVLKTKNGQIELQDFVAEGSLGWAQEPVAPLTDDEQNLFGDKMAKIPQDVNFTPEYPRAAELAKAMWEKKHPEQHIDGVIAIDPYLLQNLLGATGGVTLQDGSRLDGSNTARMLLNEVYFKAQYSDADRVFADAANSAFNHIISSVNMNAGALISAVQKSIQGGHLLLWSSIDAEQEVIGGTVVDGALMNNPAQPQTGVYFSDGTQSKMDWYLQRTVTAKYERTDEVGRKIYTVTVDLKNTVDPAQVDSLPDVVTGGSSQTQKKGQISTLAYVYAPAGGRLVDWTMSDGSQFDDVTAHNGLTVGVKQILLNAGQEYRMVIHVMTSDVVADNTDMTLRQTPVLQ